MHGPISISGYNDYVPDRDRSLGLGLGETCLLHSSRGYQAYLVGFARRSKPRHHQSSSSWILWDLFTTSPVCKNTSSMRLPDRMRYAPRLCHSLTSHVPWSPPIPQHNSRLVPLQTQGLTRTDVAKRRSEGAADLVSKAATSPSQTTLRGAGGLHMPPAEGEQRSFCIRWQLDGQMLTCICHQRVRFPVSFNTQSNQERKLTPSTLSSKPMAELKSFRLAGCWPSPVVGCNLRSTNPAELCI